MYSHQISHDVSGKFWWYKKPEQSCNCFQNVALSCSDSLLSRWNKTLSRVRAVTDHVNLQNHSHGACANEDNVKTGKQKNFESASQHQASLIPAFIKRIHITVSDVKHYHWRMYILHHLNSEHWVDVDKQYRLIQQHTCLKTNTLQITQSKHFRIALDAVSFIKCVFGSCLILLLSAYTSSCRLKSQIRIPNGNSSNMRNAE